MDKIPPRWWHATDYAEHHQEKKDSKKFSAPMMEIKGNELVVVSNKTAE
ncbi:MAG: hypothetical protein LIR40_08085 [Bacteroidota bacterium]|nr:hypothetical protein [Bacteroidota bacterium]